MNVFYFGTCQAQALARLHKILRPLDSVSCLLSYRKHGVSAAGPFFEKANLVVLQAVSPRVLAINPWLDDMAPRHRGKTLTYPRIYNSALWPIYPRDGTVMWGDTVRDQAPDYDTAARMWDAGEFEFDLKNRFISSVQHLRRVEEETDVLISDFIETTYRDHEVFRTQNHPTTFVLQEVLRQLFQIVGLPGYSPAPLPPHDEDFTDRYPHSVYETRALGLEYGGADAEASSWYLQLIKHLYTPSA